MALPVDEVRAALDDGDEAIRHRAVAGLDLTAPGAIRLLTRAMGDESWRVRGEAVERALAGVLDREQLTASLVPLLAEPENVGLRNAAVEAVVAMGAGAAHTVEQQLIRFPAHRKILCDVLGRIGEASSAGALVRCLGDVDANVQIAAAEALGRLGSGVGEEVAGALLARLHAVVQVPAAAQDSGRELLGSTLLDAMARRVVPVPVSLLVPLLGNPVLGTATLRAIGGGATPRERGEQARAAELIAPQLDATSRARREAGVLALSSLLRAEPASAPALSAAAVAAATEALMEGTVEVQRAAAYVLGVSGSAEVVRPLLVASEDPALIESVEQALGMLARRNLHALAVTVRSLSERARAVVYRVLAGRAERLPGSSSAELIAALTTDLVADDAELAVAAIAALAVLGEASSVEPLAGALEQTFAGRLVVEEPWARIDALQRALQALAARSRSEVLAVVRARSHVAPFLLVIGRIGDVSDAVGMIVQFGDPDSDARRRAAEALAALTARSEVAIDDAQIERTIVVGRDALADEAAGVRAAAIGVLLAAALRRTAGPHPATLEGLLRVARDGEARVRGAAARALVELAARASGEIASSLRVALRALADAPDSLAGVPVLEALLALHEEVDDARVLDALTGPDDERRKIALYGLATRSRLLLRGDLLGVVERALHDERWDLRRAATAALAAVGPPARAALLARRAVETDPLVLGDLERALGLRGTGTPTGSEGSGGG